MQMQQGQQGQAQTGTRDETYDVIAVVYHALQGAENCEIYAEDAADDQELRSFFEESQRSQQQLAERGKQMLAKLLQKEGGGGSAFGFSQQQSGTSSGQESLAGAGTSNPS
jgi:hypothetical protein